MPATKLVSLLASLSAWALLPAPALGQAVPASRSRVDAFFARFSDEWVRADPDLATSTRYFSGEEQNRLEQQLTPRTRARRLVVDTGWQAKQWTRPQAIDYGLEDSEVERYVAEATAN